MYFKIYKYEVNIMSKRLSGTRKINLLPCIQNKYVKFGVDRVINWLGGTIVISRRN